MKYLAILILVLISEIVCSQNLYFSNLGEGNSYKSSYEFQENGKFIYKEESYLFEESPSYPSSEGVNEISNLKREVVVEIVRNVEGQYTRSNDTLYLQKKESEEFQQKSFFLDTIRNRIINLRTLEDWYPNGKTNYNNIPIYLIENNSETGLNFYFPIVYNGHQRNRLGLSYCIEYFEFLIYLKHIGFELQKAKRIADEKNKEPINYQSKEKTIDVEFPYVENGIQKTRKLNIVYRTDSNRLVKVSGAKRNQFYKFQYDRYGNIVQINLVNRKNKLLNNYLLVGLK